MILPHLRSGGRDVGGFPNDACAHLVGVAAGRGHVRVLAAGRRPAVDVVADEGRGVFEAGHPEGGLGRVDERGHAGERTLRDPENGRALSLPRRAHGLLEETRKRKTGKWWSISDAD